MQVSASLRTALIKRALTSLLAIFAVTAILGAKAMEWEHRAAIEQAETAHPATARLAAGS
ncbi:hypothetical protein [Hyphococcus sp.]|uniref:hypothetical protein n=1 Tax=Hyphococcus sp. TaxID=2038636 RepID=UPI002087AD85|nr:MAG: hypothetical protein DHS20C04_06760 [Marinicaulis sp.]